MWTLESIIRSSPEAVGAGRLPQRSIFPLYRDVATALSELPTDTEFSLDGDWHFRFFNNPEQVADYFLTDLPDADEAKITVPGCWDMQGYGYPHYTNIQMPFSGLPPDTPLDNPTGLYRRSFNLPDHWTGQRIILRFAGVENCFYPVVNGIPLGWSKDSRGMTEFDITDLVKPTDNLLAVLVIQYSDASYVEDQDQWWHGGIVRSVTLLAQSSDHIVDICTNGILQEDLQTGVLNLELIAAITSPEELADKNAANDGMTEIRSGGRPGEGWKFRLTLYDGQTEIAKTQLPVGDKRGFVGYYNLKDYRRLYTERDWVIGTVRQWSGEDPFLYTLILELLDPQGQVIEVSRRRVGFRRVEVRHRQLLINGKPVLICGVNRHEHDPYKGRTVDNAGMRRDLTLMKQFNINAIRTSHYPDTPEFYDLCDEYGFYVFDEANIENHAFFYDICRNPNWGQSYLDRAIHLVMRDRSHPAVIVWSLGNESGIGENHAAAAAWIKRRDPTRPFLCERAIYSPDGGWRPNINRDLTDIIAPMYPKIDYIRKWAKYPTEDQRPFIMCEYSHAMGNSNGCLADYFHLFRTCHGLQGGFIWEWCDHGLVCKDYDGQEFWGYGGDFGDTPHDFNFVCDGLVSPERIPHPGLWEYKYLSQPAAFYLIDASTGRIEVESRRYFTDFSDCELVWELTRGGEIVDSGILSLPHLPPENHIPNFNNHDHHNVFDELYDNKVIIQIPYQQPLIYAGDELFLNVKLQLIKNTIWAEAGHIVATEQFAIPGHSRHVRPAEKLSDLKLQDAEVIAQDQAVILAETRAEFLRATLDNDVIKRDFKPGDGRPAQRWLAAGLFNLQLREEREEIISEQRDIFRVWHSSQGGEISQRERRVREEQRLIFTHEFTVVGIHDLPRLGVVLTLPQEFTTVKYFGRGPFENHRDRCQGSFVGLYEQLIDEMHVNYVMPQENGNRCGTRYLILSGGGLPRLKISSEQEFEFTLSRYSREMIQQSYHQHELVRDKYLLLNIDCFQRGVGTASCGPDTLNRYMLGAGKYTLQYEITVLADSQ